jgi:hypothetical protein
LATQVPYWLRSNGWEKRQQQPRRVDVRLIEDLKFTFRLRSTMSYLGGVTSSMHPALRMVTLVSNFTSSAPLRPSISSYLFFTYSLFFCIGTELSRLSLYFTTRTWARTPLFSFIYISSLCSYMVLPDRHKLTNTIRCTNIETPRTSFAA